MSFPTVIPTLLQEPHHHQDAILGIATHEFHDLHQILTSSKLPKSITMNSSALFTMYQLITWIMDLQKIGFVFSVPAKSEFCKAEASVGRIQENNARGGGIRI
jgi:hypothetical protein